MRCRLVQLLEQTYAEKARGKSTVGDVLLRQPVTVVGQILSRNVAPDREKSLRFNFVDSDNTAMRLILTSVSCNVHILKTGTA